MNKHAIELLSRLERLGFNIEEALALRRIQQTLHLWAELECGDGDNYKSWAIGRDEETDKPYMGIYPHNGESYRYAIADREKGALRRLDKIMSAHLDFTYYHQGDPRGCALYIVRRSEIRAGESLNACYTRGVAICD